MPTGDPYFECAPTDAQLTQTSEVEEILNALLVQTNTGKVGLRTVVSTATAANVTPLVGCSAANMSLADILRRIIVESPDGPAIGLVTPT